MVLCVELLLDDSYSLMLEIATDNILHFTFFTDLLGKIKFYAYYDHDEMILSYDE